MADSHLPGDHQTDDYLATTTGPQLTDESALTKVLVRAATDTPAAQQLAARFGTSRTDGEVLILGQRPTEWLLVGAAETVAAYVGGLDRSGHVSVIDHTHSRAMFRLTGATATSTLEKVCSLDWSDTMTPNGAVVSASVAKVNCDIVRHDQTDELDQGGESVRSYLLACDRSFAQYLFDAVLDASREFGTG
ncbi:MAG: sarcosine oxidase subunit gamma [Acidimicrobiales bacterium]